MTTLPKATSLPKSEFAELVAQLLELIDQKRAITDRIVEVEDLICATMAGAQRWMVEIPGLPPIKRHLGNKRTAWQHEDIFTELRLLVRDPKWRVCVDGESGEIESPVEAVARHIQRCAHVDYWRVEDLRKRGLHPDEFCSVSYGRQTIEVIRP